MSKTQVPYVYDYYNISCFTTNPKSLLKNTLARVVNALTKALNDALQLPRIVLVIVENDILKFVDKNEFGVRTIVTDCLRWVINQISRAIEAKIDNLQRRRPGSVRLEDPKIIWMKMINRNFDEEDFLLKHRTKFNDAMEELLADKDDKHLILDISDKLVDPNQFDLFNQLNSHGMSCFWHAIDEKLELFDKNKLSLKPDPFVKQHRRRINQRRRKKELKQRNYNPDDLRWELDANKHSIYDGNSTQNDHNWQERRREQAGYEQEDYWEGESEHLQNENYYE